MSDDSDLWDWEIYDDSVDDMDRNYTPTIDVRLKIADDVFEDHDEKDISIVFGSGKVLVCFNDGVLRKKDVPSWLEFRKFRIDDEALDSEVIFECSVSDLPGDIRKYLPESQMDETAPVYDNLDEVKN